MMSRVIIADSLREDYPRAFNFGYQLGAILMVVAGVILIRAGWKRRRYLALNPDLKTSRPWAAGLVRIVGGGLLILSSAAAAVGRESAEDLPTRAAAGASGDRSEATPSASPAARPTVNVALPPTLLSLSRNKELSAPLEAQSAQQSQPGFDQLTAGFYGTLEAGFIVVALRGDIADTRAAAREFLTGAERDGYVLSGRKQVSAGALGGSGECAVATRRGLEVQMCVWASSQSLFQFADGRQRAIDQSARDGLKARDRVVVLSQGGG